MTTLTPLTYLRHAGLGWTPRLLAREAVSRDPVVTMDELPLVVLGLPVVIRVTGGRAEPVVPVSSLAQTPLEPFDSAGSWQFRIAPGALFDTPFRIMHSQAGGVVMVDNTALQPEADAATPLFSKYGALDAKTEAETRRLDRWQFHLKAAQTAAADLQAEGLLKRWRDVRALFVVDRARLATLPKDRAGALHASGALFLAHLSIASQGAFDMARRPTPAVPRKRPVDETKAGAARGAFLDAFRAET